MTTTAVTQWRGVRWSARVLARILGPNPSLASANRRRAPADVELSADPKATANAEKARSWAKNGLVY